MLPGLQLPVFGTPGGGVKSTPDEDVQVWIEKGWEDEEPNKENFDFDKDMGYNQYTKQELEKAYQRAVDTGDISTFIPFEQYEGVAGRIEHELVGATLPSGDIVEGYSQHFIDRVIGQHSADDIGRPGMRRGVNIEDILEAIENPVRISEIREGAIGKSYVIFGERCSISINPETGALIQVSPLH